MDIHTIYSDRTLHSGDGRSPHADLYCTLFKILKRFVRQVHLPLPQNKGGGRERERAVVGLLHQGQELLQHKERGRERAVAGLLVQSAQDSLRNT